MLGDAQPNSDQPEELRGATDFISSLVVYARENGFTETQVDLGSLQRIADCCVHECSFNW